MQIHRDSFPRASLSDSFAANRGGKKNIYIYKEKGWWKIVLAADRKSVDVCGERAKFPGHSKFSERRIKRALSAGQTGTNSIRLVTPCVADGPVNLNGHLHEQGW